ncbi:hypothetical protein FNV43_RR09386 [Rhamnella rubrinervis]|uniref:NAB domain-containing protein n=1 Tax=Rhamnella rubrinervis TaxID=2594499 RepID=A0A8K0MK62_9ROSA|nr:hypothetical protein FNV43_RR09386 [Rhamnella rubrinervis]
MARILKIIKNEDQGKKEGKRKASKKESELVGLIDNFYKEYQSLYALYDHLIGESAKIVFGRKLEKEGSFMSSSGSDSEYYSSEEVDINTATGTANQEVEFATLEVTDLKHKLASTTKEKEALAKECNAALSKVQQAEIINKDLRSEMVSKEREIQALDQIHEAKAKQSVARIKELESQLSGLKTEMESLRSQKRDLETSCREGKAVKASKPKQKGDKNAELLQARVLELEAILKDKDDEKSALLKELKANENSSTSKIANLMAQVSNLQLEVDSLREQKGEIEERLACKRSDASSQIKVMQQELESLKLQKTELEMQLDRKTKEVSKNLIQIETLKEELTKKNIIIEKRLVEEGSYCSTQMKELELQVDTLRNQRDDLDKQKTSKIHENNQLRVEKEGLNTRIVELEGSLSERGDEASALRAEYEDGKKEAVMQIMALTAQVDTLKQELDSLKTQKSQLELQSEKMKLTGKIEDQQRNSIKEDQKDSTRKLSKEYKQTKGRLQQNRPVLHAAERKMEDLAEKCRISFENNIRLLYQRILVAEQLHTENKENYRKTKGKYEKQNKDLEETIANYEVDMKKIRNISESAGNALDGLGLVVNKFEEENCNFVNHISTISKELQIAKNWIKGTTSEIKRLKQNVDVLVAQLDDKEEQEFLLREKVWKLEAKVSKEGGEKLNLMKAMTQLEKKLVKYESLIKEKDERLVSLGDEKREAIRQLCILLDYQRSRYDHLKQLVSHLSLRCNNKTNT